MTLLIPEIESEMDGDKIIAVKQKLTVREGRTPSGGEVR